MRHIREKERCEEQSVLIKGGGGGLETHPAPKQCLTHFLEKMKQREPGTPHRTPPRPPLRNNSS